MSFGNGFQQNDQIKSKKKEREKKQQKKTDVVGHGIQ